MGEIYVYSVKVAVCLTAFYLLYKLFLSRDTLHRLNRCALLGMILASLLLPAVHLHTANPTALGVASIGVDALVVEAVAADEAQRTGLSLAQTLSLYIIGVLALAVREVWSLVGLRMLMRRGRREQTADGLRLIIVSRDVSPFSWFGNIIISQKDYEGQPREILLHESAHARLHHSADILLCDVLIIFQWFNPSAWLLKRELQAVHEYEADEAVLKSGVCAADYQLLLIRKAVGERMFSMANNFNQCSIKKRINMMMTRKSSKLSGLKLLLAVPVAACAVAAFANPKVESISDEWADEGNSLVLNVQQTTSKSEVGKQENETLGAFMAALLSGLVEKDEQQAAGATTQTEDSVSQNNVLVAIDGKLSSMAELDKLNKSDIASIEVLKGEDATKLFGGDIKGRVMVVKTKSASGKAAYDVAEVLPKFPGGTTAMKAYLSKEMHYPEAAVKAKEQGCVIVQFVVDEDGTVCEPTVLRGVSAALDAEALRVVKNMPKWTPGQQAGKNVRCKYAMPIKFDLGNKGGEVKDEKAANNTLATTLVGENGKTTNNAHIYFLDGKRITDTELKKVKPSTIESMTVLNGKSATDKYGEEGKNGVVEITTKK